jgi:hypothetical protein
MKTETKESLVKFGIVGIRELEYFFKDPMPVVKKAQLNEENVTGQVNVNYKWNLEESKFAVVVNISYLIKETEDNLTEYFKLSFMNEYHVEGLTNLFSVSEDGNFKINEQLEVSLVSIAVSTGRGIAYEKTKGTPFSRFIFPIINPTDLLLSKKQKSKD